MPGIGISLFLIAVGAILDFAVTTSPDQHVFNINTVGLILLIIGAVGFVLSPIFCSGMRGGWGWGSSRRQRTVITDNHGNVVRREEQDQYV